MINYTLKFSKNLIKRHFIFNNFFNQNKGLDKKQTEIEKIKKMENLNIIIQNIKNENKSRTPLPNKLENDKNKLTVFVDIDDVFLYTFYPEENEGYLGNPERNYDYIIDYQEKNLDISIYKREYMDKFLKYIKNNTEGILFSTGIQSYVDLIAV